MEESKWPFRLKSLKTFCLKTLLSKFNFLLTSFVQKFTNFAIHIFRLNLSVTSHDLFNSPVRNVYNLTTPVPADGWRSSSPRALEIQNRAWCSIRPPRDQIRGSPLRGGVINWRRRISRTPSAVLASPDKELLVRQRAKAFAPEMKVLVCCVGSECLAIVRILMIKWRGCDMHLNTPVTSATERRAFFRWVRMAAVYQTMCGIRNHVTYVDSESS